MFSTGGERDVATRRYDAPVMTEQTKHSARALAISSTVLATGAGAHVSAGGALPSVLALAALGALTLALASALARRAPRLGVLGPSMIALQFVLHNAFMYLGTGVSTSGTDTGHAHHVDPAAVVATTRMAMGPDHATSYAMLAAHAVAALAAAVLITAIDRAGHAATRWWQSVLPAASPVSLVPRAARTAAPRGPRVPALTPAFRQCVQRRGPPAALHA